MAVRSYPVRVANPHGKKAAARSSRRGAARAGSSRKAANPGEYIMALGYLNPEKKKGGRAMPSKKKGRKKSAHNPHRGKSVRASSRKKGVTRKKGNPFRGASRRMGLFGSAIGIIKAGIFAAFGFVLARQIPQWLLGSGNQGFLGYALNLGSAVAVSMAASFAGFPDIGVALGIGGGVQVVNRVIQDKLSPVGRILNLQGVGDAMSLGEIVYDGRAYFPLPVAWDGDRPVIPRQIVDASVAAMSSQNAVRAAMAGGNTVTMPPTGMSGTGYASRFVSRFRGAQAA